MNCGGGGFRITMNHSVDWLHHRLRCLMSAHRRTVLDDTVICEAESDSDNSSKHSMSSHFLSMSDWAVVDTKGTR